jgi:hypothetical protein
MSKWMAICPAAISLVWTSLSMCRRWGSARALSTASGLETMVAAWVCLLAFTAVITW